MKKVFIIIAAMITMVNVNAQTLSERQKGLAACACLMAQGDLQRLEPAVRNALDNGVTVNELKEAFSQLYAYTGFPRSLNALGMLSRVLENRNPSWKEGSLGAALPNGMMQGQHGNLVGRIRQRFPVEPLIMISVPKTITI